MCVTVSYGQGRMGAVVQRKNQHKSWPTALGLEGPDDSEPLVTNRSFAKSDARVPEVEREVLIDLRCSFVIT